MIVGNSSLDQPTPWFPDRLLQVTHTVDEITARVVLKCDPEDFPPAKVAIGIHYISLSHCWGPPPDPSALLGGRIGTVLTKENLASWRKDLLLDNMPLAFQHAVQVCIALGFEYIWIDSLCIIQNSPQDWDTQSAVMGDVYKFAWLNVAAASTTSDYQGFINESRDARVEFGFRAPFATILGQGYDKNEDGQECILLRGKSRLHWNSTSDSASWDAPLYSRAWVFQERNL